MRGSSAPYFSALNRPFTVFGVDRQLFFLIVGLSLPLVFAGNFRLMMDLFALSVFVVLYTAGVLLTRVDQQFLLIARRHIHYRRYYAPVAGIHAPLKLIKPSVPIYQGQRGLV